LSGWIILLIAGGAAAADTTAFLQTMLHQPLVIGTLLGAALGLPIEGAYLGALLQLLWIADLPIGAAVFPDKGPVAAGTIGAALLAIAADRAGMGEAGLAVLVLAIPLAWAGGLVVTLQREFQGRFQRAAMASFRDGGKGHIRRYLFAGIGLAVLRGILVAAVSALLLDGLVRVAGYLPHRPGIAPHVLLAGVLGLGLAQALRLFEPKAQWPWMAAGLLFGTLWAIFL
jgi:mannose/fructose/N-acetylgalactosamine-specific phosphotransferase system component IIC